MEKKAEISYLVFTITTLICVALAFFIGVNVPQDNCQEIKQVLYFESLEIEIADQVTDIYDYYSLASNSYDYSDYTNVIFYCEKSRSLSTSYSQKLRTIKAEYPSEPIEILRIRKQMIETEIEYLFALYQSCEYLESASRAYSNYDYQMGDVNIEGQNEQITIHDSKVEEYYNLEARYQKLKREIINE